MSKNLKLPKVLLLLSVIFLSCALLIFINFFTIKILSANRAYVNGESNYSKAQKDAVRYLITYLNTEEASQWKLFKEELSVPQGDGSARIALTNNGSLETIKNGFRAGRNHEKDIEDLIWLFRYFNSLEYMEKAIKEWKTGDFYINQLNGIGDEIKEQIQASKLDKTSKTRFLLRISDISNKLTINERNFSNTLGDGTREIKNYLIYTNIFFILVIMCSVSLYYAIMVKRLLRSQQLIEAKNKDLTLANKELDRFVYSASHDLRSPISSLKGLVDILKTEEDPEEVKNYLGMMQDVLNKQDQFIKDIIDYSRNKRTQDVFKKISLAQIIAESISQHLYMEEVKKIKIEKKLLVDKITSDNLRLKIIINNLLSNAIKYADFGKEQPYINIKTALGENNFTIEVEDNGIGINKQYLNRIFDMFFVTNKNKGTGLGLYIVKEAIENLNGSIVVESKINIGTKFIVTLPLHNEQ